ncbi:hypothetical protein BDY24DRAFT_413634 [Mrakia frigida]|uniref:uncharacterized protein n=1 Tax=Mrakia frigida TaxID=29902 RepID=UPI003FCC138A
MPYPIARPIKASHPRTFTTRRVAPAQLLRGDVVEALEDISDEKAGWTRSEAVPEKEVDSEATPRRELELDLGGLVGSAKKMRVNNSALALDYVLLPSLPTTHVLSDFPPPTSSPPTNAFSPPRSEDHSEEEEDGWELIGEGGNGTTVVSGREVEEVVEGGGSGRAYAEAVMKA